MSSMGDAFAGLIAALAESESFVARCLLSKVSPSDPSAHVYLDAAMILDQSTYGPEMDDLRPFVVLSADGHGFSKQSSGVTDGMLATDCSIWALVTDVAREKSDPATPNATALDFINFASGMIDEIAGRSGYGDRFSWNGGISLAAPYERTDFGDREEGFDLWTCAYEFRFGAVT